MAPTMARMSPLAAPVLLCMRTFAYSGPNDTAFDFEENTRMKRVGKNSIALGLVIALVSLALSFSANGATTKTFKSYGEAQYVAALDNALGGLLIDPLVDATLESDSGARACEPATKDCPAFASTKSPLGDALKPLTGQVGDALSSIKGQGVGVISDYARAGKSAKPGAKPGASKGASGAVSNEGAVDLASAGDPSRNYSSFALSSGALAPIAKAVADARFDLGAVAATAQLDSPTAKVQRDYGVAGAKIVLQVPVLKALNGAIGGAVPSSGLPPVTTITVGALCKTLNDFLGGIAGGGGAPSLPGGGAGDLTGVVGGILGGLGLPGLPGAKSAATPSDGVTAAAAGPLDALCDPLAGALDKQLEVKITGLDALTTGLTNITQNGVTFDFKTGSLTIDLAKAVKAMLNKDINNLPPNTDLVKAILPSLVVNLDQIVKRVNDTLKDLSKKIGVEITVGGTKVPLDSLNAALQAQILPGLTGVIDQVTANLKTITDPLSQGLLTLTDGLSQVLQLIVNVPDVYSSAASKRPAGAFPGLPGIPGVSAAKAGDKSKVYSETALRVRVLGGQAADLLLGNALVGPNSEGSKTTPDTNADVNADTVADANADANADAVADANADANADADVTSALPNTGAPNVLPLLLLALGLVGFGTAVLANERRRLGKL